MYLQARIKELVLTGVIFCLLIWGMFFATLMLVLEPVRTGMDKINISVILLESKVAQIRQEVDMLTAQVSSIQQDLEERTIIHEKLLDIPPMYQSPNAFDTENENNGN